VAAENWNFTYIQMSEEEHIHTILVLLTIAISYSFIILAEEIQCIRDRKMSKSDYYVTLCNIFVFILWHAFDNSTFFLLAKTWSQKQKHCCKFAQCRQRQKIIVRNQLVYSICLKRIPSLVTKCWCLCVSHKEVIESNVQDTFRITLHI
jgi:hypothetical protein